MLVIVTRGIDVSVGSITGVAAMAVGMLFRAQPHLPLPIGVLVGLVCGFALGCLNGAFIAAWNVPPIIATLGTLSGFRGLIFIMSKGVQVDSNDIPDGVTKWAGDGPLHLGGVTVPWLLVAVAAIALLASWFVHRTRLGRDIYAYGSHPEAARLRGVPVKRTVFWVYAITGALCGLAGVCYISRFGFVNPGSAGAGLELSVIAAVVIGGTNVTGGVGTVLGVLLGCVMLAVINVALAVLGIDATWQQLVYGVVILFAVLVDTFTRRALGRMQEAGA
jgi:rhamnose transport system permease protein